MQKITRNVLNRRIENFKEYAQQYSKESLVQVERLEKALDRAQYKIAVVANMSAGKTALINALFGKDVLPSYNEATSDCAIYIHSRLPDGEKQAKIYFSSESKKPIVVLEGMDKDFIYDLKQYAKKDSDEMNVRYKEVERIELYYPFYNIRADHESVAYDVVLIDTPGPNNTDEYSEKHKDQTREALAESDMVLFVFSYAELDANLATDEQRLWKPILERLEKDEDFCVYFVLNKIDFAIDDNIRDIDRNSENFYELKREKWFDHEGKAIEKLGNKLKEIGVKHAEIFPVSSKYQLLKRLDKLNDDDEDELDSFEKRHFKRVFDEDEWESRLVEYLGIEKLEKSINHYIQNQVEQKIHKRFFYSINSLIKEESLKIQTAIQTLSKPKDQAMTDLLRAKKLLEKETPRIYSQTQEKIDEVQEEAQEKIDLTIRMRVQKKVYDEIEGIVRQAAHFAIVYADTGDVHDAKNLSENENAHLDVDWSRGVVDVEIKQGIDKQQVFAEMEKYLNSCLLERVNDYKDVIIDVKNIIHDYQRDSGPIIQTSKEKLQEMVSKTLEIQTDEIRIEEIGDLDLFVGLDSSLVDYEHQKAEWYKRSTSVWYKPWTWGDEEWVKSRDEKHYIKINTSDLREQLRRQTQDFFEVLKETEIERYGNAVVAYSQGLMKVFEDFAQAKQKEIIDIQGKIENIDEEIKKLHQQEKELRLKLEKK